MQRKAGAFTVLLDALAVALLLFVQDQAFGKMQIGAFMGFGLVQQLFQSVGNTGQAETAVLLGDAVNGRYGSLPGQWGGHAGRHNGPGRPSRTGRRLYLGRCDAFRVLLVGGQPFLKAGGG